MSIVYGRKGSVGRREQRHTEKMQKTIARLDAGVKARACGLCGSGRVVLRKASVNRINIHSNVEVTDALPSELGPPSKVLP